MTRLLPQTPVWALLAALLFAPSAQAAGGHHAVDDAAILEEGLCKLESWLSGRPDNERLVHAGGGCRVGPVELNAAGEYTRTDGSSQTDYSVQVKWATELAPGFSAGVSLATGWQAHARPRHQGGTVAGLFTWVLRDDLAVHLNVGRDLVRGAADQDRGGVAAEWRAHPNWSFVAERYLESGTHFFRGGARWAVSDRCSIDLSRAQRLHGPSASNWTLGATWQFPR